MKTLRYKLLGNPHNMDDCLDISYDEKPQKVTMELTVYEIITETSVCKQCIGKYEWEFSDRLLTFEEIYGVCSAFDSNEKQRLSIDHANAMLEKSLKRIEELEIDVYGKEERFDYSIIYKSIEQNKRFWATLKSIFDQTGDDF